MGKPLTAFDEAVQEFLVFDFGKDLTAARQAIALAKEEEWYAREEVGAEAIAETILNDPKYWVDSSPNKG